jgi:hypothetical protein
MSVCVCVCVRVRNSFGLIWNFLLALFLLLWLYDVGSVPGQRSEALAGFSTM